MCSLSFRRRYLLLIIPQRSTIHIETCQEIQLARAVCIQLRDTIDDPANLRSILDSRHSLACSSFRATSDAVTRFLGDEVDFLQKVVCAVDHRGLSNGWNVLNSELSDGARSLLCALLGDRSHHVEDEEECCCLANALVTLHCRRPDSSIIPGEHKMTQYDDLDALIDLSCSKEVLERVFDIKESDLRRYYESVSTGNIFSPEPAFLDPPQFALTGKSFELDGDVLDLLDSEFLAVILGVPVIMEELTYCVRTRDTWRNRDLG